MPLLTGSFDIPSAHAQPLLTRSRQNSFVLQNGTSVPVTGSGTIVPVFTTDVGGGWTDEAAPKPVNEAAVSKKNMTVHKWSTIVPVSEEAVLDNTDFANIMASIAENAQGTFARAIDTLAMTGGGISGQSYIDQTTKSASLGTTSQVNGGIWGDFNAALRALLSDSATTPRVYTGALLDAVVEPEINGAVDANGRPIWVDVPVGESNSVNRFGRLIGRPAALEVQVAHGTGANKVVGYLGNWERVFYGLVGGLRVDYSNQATYVTGGVTHSAWQENLVLARVEARIGILVADPLDFVKILAGSTPLSS